MVDRSEAPPQAAEPPKLIGPPPSVSGNYDPNRGVVFKALNQIENEVFCSEPYTGPPQNHGLVHSALVYLNYGVYQ